MASLEQHLGQNSKHQNDHQLCIPDYHHMEIKNYSTKDKTNVKLNEKVQLRYPNVLYLYIKNFDNIKYKFAMYLVSTIQVKIFSSFQLIKTLSAKAL